MKNRTYLVIPIIAAFFLLNLNTFSSPLEAGTKADRARLAETALVLSDLRDQLADHHALILQKAMEVNIRSAQGQPFRSLEEIRAVLGALLLGASKEDRAKMESVFQTLEKLENARKAYDESVLECRNSLAASLLLSIALEEIAYNIRQKTDTIFFGEDMFYGETRGLIKVGKARLETGSAGPATAEGEPEPARQASTNPEILKAAYEASQAWLNFILLYNQASATMQMAAAGAVSPIILNNDPVFLRAARAGEALGRLPDLGPQELKMIEKLPNLSLEMMDKLETVRENILRKAAVQDELQALTAEALKQVGDLRDDYIRRLP